MPPSRKEFSIRKAEGNERGESIVRRVLEHEAGWRRVRATPIFAATTMILLCWDNRRSMAGWRMSFSSSPKHESVELLRGKAWVDAENFLVVRVEGEPAKSPSWWVKNLNVVIDYGRADGVWLPLATRATADVRLLGTHILTSKDVEVQAATENAKLSPVPRRAPQRNGSRRSIDQAAVWAPR